MGAYVPERYSGSGLDTVSYILIVEEINRACASTGVVLSSHLSLAIERGAFFSLLGPSGCGKTTTLRLIAGFEARSAGEIWLNGSRIDELPPYRR